MASWSDSDFIFGRGRRTRSIFTDRHHHTTYKIRSIALKFLIMLPFQIPSMATRLKPGQKLDFGCRDFFISSQFAEVGYRVHGFDPAPPLEVCPPRGVTIQQTTFKAFTSNSKCDLVIASLVSQFVSLTLSEFLARLYALCRIDGLIYIALSGDKDSWASKPKVKAVSFEHANQLIAGSNPKPTFTPSNWFEGSTYDGTSKDWHVY